jgi:hypothetical protein
MHRFKQKPRLAWTRRRRDVADGAPFRMALEMDALRAVLELRSKRMAAALELRNLVGSSTGSRKRTGKKACGMPSPAAFQGPPCGVAAEQSDAPAAFL